MHSECVNIKFCVTSPFQLGKKWSLVSVVSFILSVKFFGLAVNLAQPPFHSIPPESVQAEQGLRHWEPPQEFDV